MRKFGWGVMLFTALIVVAYGAAVLFIPDFGPPFVLARKAMMPFALFGHVAGGVITLALGPWQFVGGLRRRWPTVHRWMGRGYLLGVGIGGVAGITLAFRTDYGTVVASGFFTLGVLWLVAGTMAFLRIRARDIPGHRRWMVRSFALTMAAVMLRVYLPITGILGIPFELAYPPIAWLSWLPNLLLVEGWRILGRAAGHGVVADA